MFECCSNGLIEMGVVKYANDDAAMKRRLYTLGRNGERSYLQKLRREVDEPMTHHVSIVDGWTPLATVKTTLDERKVHCVSIAIGCE